MLRQFVLLTGFLAASASASDGDVALGARIVNDNCGRCHNVRPAQEFDRKEWSVILPHMRERAHLTGTETDAVLAFFTQLQAPSERTEQSSPAASAGTSAERGRAIVAQFACQACHTMGGTGGTLGPSLDGVVQRKGKAFVREKIRDPQASNPTSAMPKLPLDAADLDALVDYLAEPK